MIKLGSKCRDKVTSFSGIAMARTSYITGCDRYSLQSVILGKEGKPEEWQTFDENQLETLKVDAVELKPLVTPQVPPPTAARVGGPRPAAGKSNRDVSGRGR